MNAGSDRAISRASVVASFSLVLGLAATVGYVAWPRIADAVGFTPAKAPPAYVSGQQVDAPAAWYEKAPYTLVLFARANCGACEKARPFLAELIRGVEGRSAVVMAGPSATRQEDAEFARSLGIPDEHIAVVPPSLRVRATPTLVLVNQQGLILEAWEGVGSPEHQEAIVKAVDAALR